MSKALGASLILPLCAGTFRVHFFPGVFEESLVSELSDGRNEPQAIQAAALTSECGNTSIFQPTEFGAHSQSQGLCLKCSNTDAVGCLPCKPWDRKNMSRD